MNAEELFEEYQGQMMSQGNLVYRAHYDTHTDDAHIQEYWDEP